MIYLKFPIVCIREKEELRALKVVKRGKNKEKSMSMEKKERKKKIEK
jgi:hypothetical protein